MTGDEARRRPVWLALSELFLDTELTEEDYRRIAIILSRSGYPTERLRHILEEEVAPAFVSNLLDTAGVWTPWDEAEVAEIIGRSRCASAPSRWLRRRLFKKYVQGEWVKVNDRLEEQSLLAD